MNLNGIAKLYGHIDPLAQLALIDSAATRADWVERDRLARASPRLRYSFPDYAGYAMGMEQLTMVTHMQLLSLAGKYWEGLTFLAGMESGEEESTQPTAEAGAVADRICMVAHDLLANFEGLRQFVAESRLNLTRLQQALPGYEFVLNTASACLALAFTAEQATKWRQEQGLEGPSTTPADVVAAMKDYLDKSAKLLF